MKHLILILSAALVPLTACGSDHTSSSSTSTASTETTTPSVDPAQIKQGKQLYMSLGCAPCHGETGKGDGMLSESFDAKPRDYTDAAWQAATTDEHIRGVIMEGGAAHGLSSAMTPQAARFNNEQELDAIVAFIRSLD